VKHKERGLRNVCALECSACEMSPGIWMTISISSYDDDDDDDDDDDGHHGLISQVV
jgi:hypothetical protein